MEKLLSVAAWLLLIYGVFLFVISFGFASSGNFETFQHYWPGKTIGEAIDKGLIALVVGLLCGTVAKIARKLDAKEPSSQ